MKSVIERLRQRHRIAWAYSRPNYDEMARVEGCGLSRIAAGLRAGCRQTQMRQLSDDHDYGQGPFVKRFD